VTLDQQQPEGPRHVHEVWEGGGPSLANLARCDKCGLAMLRLFVNSSKWVVRRVERIDFLNDRMVRRRVSVDCVTPRDAVALGLGSDQVTRVLPLTIMRKKSLLNFDLRSHEGEPIPLLGLRESQALTHAVVRAWAVRALDADEIDAAVDRWLWRAVSGAQAQMVHAYKEMWAADTGQALARLRDDDVFRAVLDRLADSFLLYTTDDRPVGQRHVIKFSYDEPLTLRYRWAGYVGHPDEPRYAEGGTLGWWRRTPLTARLGLRPTLVRFPVPAAELAASFHFEVTAPPDVSIVQAALLAGRPNRRPRQEREIDPDGDPHEPTQAMLDHKPPSFDHVAVSGHSTVDLHVAEVPYGGLARAQVSLQASTQGWLPTAAMACWLTTATLAAAFLAHHPRSDISATVLVTFTAGIVALLARPDRHRMVTRLLSAVRNLAGVSSSLALAAAVVFAFVPDDDNRHVLLGSLALASVLPSAAVSLSWVLALSKVYDTAQLSPWEQHCPEHGNADKLLKRVDVELARSLENDEFAYDTAVQTLRFDRPAIRVASSEGTRERFPWDRAFSEAFDKRMEQETRPSSATPG
jgi:hypothetical protein